MRQVILERLISIISEDLEARVAAVEITPDTPFFEGGLELDSFAVVELIGHVEEHYDFEFSDADFLPENFVDLSTFAALVERYIAAPR